MVPRRPVSSIASAALTMRFRNTWLRSAMLHITGRIGAQLQVQIGHGLHLVTGDGDRRRQRLVQIGRHLVRPAWMAEGLHRADDRRHALDQPEGLLDRARDLPLQVVQLHRGLRLLHPLQPFLPAQRLLGEQEPTVEQHRPDQVLVRVGQKPGVVPDELDGGVDLVRQTGGQPAERFELRVLVPFGFLGLAVADVARDPDDRCDDALVVVDGGRGDRRLHAPTRGRRGPPALGRPRGCRHGGPVLKLCAVPARRRGSAAEVGQPPDRRAAGVDPP